PLISRERVIAILVLGHKRSGRFSMEDFSVIKDVTGRVAVSMEKEYLREQLREREEEISVINNSSVILSSSLDIQEIFGSFIEELKKVVDVTWSSIALVEEDEIRCTALSSPENADYKVGDTIPLEGSGAGWVLTQKKLFIEPDLQKDHYFDFGANHKKFGLRTMVYLPLIVKGRAIGSFIVASGQPNAYTQRHVKLLEQLASQIAMPLENTQLYIKAEKKARIDELTGLLNRRSLDEMLDNEISRHSRYGGEFSLAIIDLDSFKAYNDTYGHLSGDSLLREIGNTIKMSIRNADHAFRYGGDEFAIVLPQTDIESASQVADRVRRKIGSGIDTKDVAVTASIGIASWPGDGVSHTDIITAADVTLYQAKRNGGNQTLCASGVSVIEQLAETLATGESGGKKKKILDVARALAETIDSKSKYSKNHSQKVSEHALILGRAIEMNADDLERLHTSALLHDIGKIGISEAILDKSGDLNAEEWDIMKTHSRLGAAIASNIAQTAQCQEAILHHHEWFNGAGYPDGLKGDDIPVEARILSIADAFVAMTTNSAYAVALTGEQALGELKKNAGKQFDPELVNMFISVYDKKHTGAPGKVRR
ncbi:MAG: diguanylate cyclase, partial [Dehalococcoidales bacterium]|nr:diguanylate cyclase [Dehalococcoidales bacterium]